MIRKVLVLLSALFIFSVFASAQTPTPTPAATSTAPAKTPSFRPTKDQIKQGQTLLIKEKLWTGEATGVYGESRPAIKAYQKANGLDENGKFDRATLNKMGIALTDSQKGITPAASATTSKDPKPPKTTSATTDGPKRPAPFRADVDQIKDAQKILRDGKMLTGGEDGKLDDTTREGLGKYQEANGLKATKTLNAGTLQKMGITLTDKQKEQVAAQAAYDAAKAKN